MSYKDENYNKVAKLPINHFLTANNKLWGKITVGYALSKFKIRAKNESWLKYLSEKTW